MLESEGSSASPDRPPNMAELLARIGQSRAALEHLVAPLDEHRLSAPGGDGWSIKDHLAHLAVWQQSLLALLEGRDREAAIGIHTGDDDDAGDVDALNAVLHARRRDRPLPEVLAEFRRSQQQVLTALERLSDADLAKPYAHYQPEDDDQRPVIGWIIGNTYGHEEEHLPAIRALAGVRA